MCPCNPYTPSWNFWQAAPTPLTLSALAALVDGTYRLNYRVEMVFGCAQPIAHRNRHRCGRCGTVRVIVDGAAVIRWSTAA
jgi:hypothetical protein